MVKTIIAFGGIPLSNKTDFVLEKYILAQSGQEKPSILFIPTASGDSATYIAAFYSVFHQLPCTPRHLSLFDAPKGLDIKTYILSHDIIFVGGGNTVNLMLLWKAWGVDAILRTAWEHGKIMVGSSAGSLCWFAQGITDSLPEGLTAMSCMGFLPISNCPHYNDEPKRRPAYHKAMVAGQVGAGIAQDQYVGLHFRGTELYKAVTNKPQQNAYAVRLNGDEIVETVIVAELLK